MIVHNKDVDKLGIKTIETNNEGEVTAVNGILPIKTLSEYNLKFSVITDKIIHWAEIELDYAGG